MPKKYENKRGYAYFNGEPSKTGIRRTLTVTVMLDPVPGAFHEVDHHIQYLMSHMPYIQDITLEDEE